MKVLTLLDLQQNTLQNAVIVNLAAAPATPKEGQIYYDTVIGSLGVYTGAAWTYFSVTAIKKYTVAIGNGTLTSITVTHNLNTTAIQLNVLDSSGNYVETDWQAATANTAILTFSVAPTTNQYTVVVVG